jgi:hypothetical protein
MKTRFLTFLTLAVITVAGVTSCIKDEVTPLTTEGEAFLKLSEAPEYKLFLAPFTDVRKISLFTVVRDAANSSQLNTAATVKLTNKGKAAVDAYNTAHGTDYELLPDSLYTLAGGITNAGAVYTVPLAPGDFAKKYALAFTITDSAGINISDGIKDVIVLISVKNKYDGVYSLRAKMLDWDAAYGISNVAWLWPYDVSMITSSATSLNLFSDAHGTYIHPAMTSALGPTGFGVTNPRFTFDLTTDKIIDVKNDIVNPSNGRAFKLNTAYDSRYDPASKTIYAAIILTQPGRPDLQIFDTLKFVRAR